MSCTVIWRE
jgi:hypothetical protein